MIRSKIPYRIKAILLSLRGVEIPIRDSEVSMSVRVEGTGKVIFGKAECRPHAYFACKKGAKLQLGDDVFVNRNTIMICHREIIIGDGTGIGPNVCIFDHDHLYGEDGMAKKDFKELDKLDELLKAYEMTDLIKIIDDAKKQFEPKDVIER